MIIEKLACDVYPSAVDGYTGMSKIEMSIIIIRFSVLDMNMIKMIKMGSCFFLHLNHKIKVD